MSQFMIRIELHRATEPSYQRLHEYMAAEGIGRTIKASDGVTYHLPTGTYYVLSGRGVAPSLQLLSEQRIEPDSSTRWS
jgi:hypothetical protein